MVILYKANATEFNNLGLGPLNEAISCLVTEERNGIFELEMKYPIDGKRFNDIKLDRIIKTDAGYNLKNQRFKIIRITKPIDGIVTIIAEHVSLLTQDLALNPLVTFSGSAQSAISSWKNGIIDANPFTVQSDITTTGSGKWTVQTVGNAREALGGVAGSLLDVYGGEYRFDNYDIRLMAKRGINSGALIAYGRNIIDLTQEESIAETYTSIYPYSVYRDESNPNAKEQLITAPGYIVDSDYVANYARRKIKVVDFTEEKISDPAKLATRAKAYMKANGYGIPKVNMKLKYLDLAKTLDYKDKSFLEEVNLCDTVFIYFEKQDINTSAKVIKTVWDSLQDRYDSIEVGSSRSGLSESINTVVDGKLETVVKQVNTVQATADGLNKIYRGPDEPLTGNIGDLWYEQDGIYENMYQFDGSIWKLILSTRDLDSVKREVEEHTGQIAIEKERVNDVIIKADQAIEDAGFAGINADEAKANAIEALGKADSAKTEAAESLTKANQAITDAGIAKTKAETAIVDAGSAIADATKALENYDNLNKNGFRNILLNSQNLKMNGSDQGNSGLIQKIGDWLEFTPLFNGNVYNLDFETSVERTNGKWYTFHFEISTVQTMQMLFRPGNWFIVDIPNTGGEWQHFVYTYEHTGTTRPGTDKFLTGFQNLIAGNKVKYRRMAINEGKEAKPFQMADEDVNVIVTDLDGKLSRKVEQTTYDGLAGTVATHSTEISQTKTDLQSKANSSVVDTLNGTVTQHGTLITQNAQAIGLKADTSVVNALNGTVTQQGLDIVANAQGLASKVNQSVFDTTKNLVTTHTTQISQNATAIASKVEKSVVDGIKGTVDTHTTQIAQNATAITSKASQSSVDTLSGTVSTQGTLLTQTANALSSKAESSLVNTIKGTVETHTSQISQNATAITARLTSAQVDALVVGKKYVNETTLNATANGITSTVTQLSTKVDSKTDIVTAMNGGGKIFSNPVNFSTSVGTVTGMLIIETPITSSYMTKLSISGFNYTGSTTNIDLEVSFYAYQPTSFVNFSYVNKGNYPIDKVQLARTSDGRAVVLIGLPTNSWAYPKIAVTEAIIGHNEPPDSFKSGWSIKFSTATTGYTNLHNVLGTDFDFKISKVEQTINGIQTTVADKADKSQITQLSTQISAKVESSTYNSKMTLLDQAINLRVTSAGVNSIVDASILADKTIKDTRNDNQNPNWYWSNYPKQTVVEFKLRTTMGLTTGSDTYGTLTSEVPWNDSSAGYVTQTFKTGTGTFTRQGQTTSWTDWVQVPDVARIVSQINLSPAGVYIQGKNIQLDGNVSMQTAFVDKIKAIDLIADRITTGTLNASNVNIINLNASKVTAGTFNGLTFYNPWTVSEISGTTTLKGDLTSNYTMTNGQYGAMAFSRDRIFSNLYNANGVLARNFNLSAEALNFTSGLGSATFNFDEMRADRNDGASSAVTWAYSTFPMQIFSTQHTLLGISISGVRSTRIEYGGSGANAFVKIFGNLNLQGNTIQNAGNIEWDASSSIKRGTNSMDIRAKTIFSISLSGFAGLYVTRNTSNGTNAVDVYGTLNMQGNVITNQSDARLKENILPTKVKALELFEQYNFVEFDWKGKKPTSEKQFGLIAQDTPFLSGINEETGIWELNSSKQIMLNSLGVKELNNGMKEIKKDNEKLKERMVQLEQKVKELESA